MQAPNTKHKKEEKKIPNLRFPGFEGEWESKVFGDLTQDASYGMNSAAIEFDGINKYLRITDIDEKSRKFVPKPLTSPNGELEDKYRLKMRDIVFARTGASVGKCYLYNDFDGRLYYAGFLIKFSIKKNAEPYFIYSYTFVNNYMKWVKVMSMRSGQPGINSEEYKSLKFHIPSLPEQKKIASFLSAVDQKIQHLIRKKEVLELYKKGVMQKIFSREIRFKPDNAGFDSAQPAGARPEVEKSRVVERSRNYPDWEEKRLGELAQRITIKNKDNKITFVLTNSAVEGVVNQREYFDKDIANQNNLKGYYIVSKNDFVYNPRISSSAPVGPIKRNNLKKGVMSPLYTIFCFNDENLDFFEFFFETKVWHRYMHSVANFGVRHDRLNITNDDFFKLPITSPSEEERRRIICFLRSISKEIEFIKIQLTQTQKFKKGLLQQMFV